MRSSDQEVAKHRHLSKLPSFILSKPETNGETFRSVACGDVGRWLESIRRWGSGAFIIIILL